MSFDPKLKSFKEEWEWLTKVDSQALANAYMDMKQAYKNFFEGRAKYPKYKSKKDRQSYRNAMCHKDLGKLIVGHTIVLPKVGPVNYPPPKGGELVMLPMLPWQAYSTIGWLTGTLPSRFSEYRRAAS